MKVVFSLRSYVHSRGSCRWRLNGRGLVMIHERAYFSWGILQCFKSLRECKVGRVHGTSLWSQSPSSKQKLVSISTTSIVRLLSPAEKMKIDHGKDQILHEDQKKATRLHIQHTERELKRLEAVRVQVWGPQWRIHGPSVCLVGQIMLKGRERERRRWSFCWAGQTRLGMQTNRRKAK